MRFLNHGESRAVSKTAVSEKVATGRSRLCTAGSAILIMSSMDAEAAT